MLKSSSLCLYSSNLGKFWLKIKQFWLFEEISIFSDGDHLGWRTWLSDITFRGNPLRMIQAKFGLNWPSGFREDCWKILQTDDGRQVMAIAHTGELKRQQLLQKWSNQIAVMICTSSYGNKQACKVLNNSHLKWRRNCAYILFDEIF